MMERNSGNVKNKSKWFSFFAVFTFILTGVQAQDKSSVSGKVIDENNLPVPFANVVLTSGSTDSILSESGTLSNENGLFFIESVHPGRFKIRISSVGYKSISEIVDVKNIDITDVGTIVLRDSIFTVNETVVVGDRIKGKSEHDKTIFYINKKILDVSGTGIDVLKYIPGVQVDLKQNISLEGSTGILIYVDGIERSKSFVSQLSPAQIDKIEIINSPPSGYDSNITGVINIILKKNKNTGVSGHVHVELPTSNSEIFLFPSMSVNYGFKKLNLFASYNGEINYENIDECVNRKRWNGSAITTISSVQEVRQRNLYHQFHYGLDFFLNDKNQFNFYGFINPYSYEQNGDVLVEVRGGESTNWQGQRREKESNTGYFNSFFYKHIFIQKGGGINIDISHFYLESSNTTSFIHDNTQSGSGSYFNIQSPKQNALSAKTDLILPLDEKLTLNSGIKAKFQKMADKSSAGFLHNNTIFAAYITFNYKLKQTNINAGMRFENSKAKFNGRTLDPIITALPYFTCNYKLNTKQNIKVAFNRTVNRPSVYQLNSFILTDNANSVTIGNPLLKPQFLSNISLEHTVQLKSNFISAKIFYTQANHVMNNMSVVNENGVFKTQMQNLGKISQFGGQFLASLKAGPVMFNPSVRLYKTSTYANEVAAHAGVKNRSNLVFEPNLSTIIALKNSWALSAIIQYSTPRIFIQDNTFCGILYFVSADKTFKNNIKIGATSALPFTGNFIYNASEVQAADFSIHYEGHLKLSAVPLWISVSYQFGSGAKKEKIEREKEEVDQQLKSGF